MNRNMGMLVRSALVALSACFLAACSTSTSGRGPYVAHVTDGPSAEAVHSFPARAAAMERAATHRSAAARSPRPVVTTRAHGPSVVRVAPRLRAARECWRCGR
jgi:hypothetical protein